MMFFFSSKKIFGVFFIKHIFYFIQECNPRNFKTYPLFVKKHLARRPKLGYFLGKFIIHIFCHLPLAQTGHSYLRNAASSEKTKLILFIFGIDLPGVGPVRILLNPLRSPIPSILKNATTCIRTTGSPLGMKNPEPLSYSGK